MANETPLGSRRTRIRVLELKDLYTATGEKTETLKKLEKEKLQPQPKLDPIVKGFELTEEEFEFPSIRTQYSLEAKEKFGAEDLDPVGQNLFWKKLESGQKSLAPFLELARKDPPAKVESDPNEKLTYKWRAMMRIVPTREPERHFGSTRGSGGRGGFRDRGGRGGFRGRGGFGGRGRSPPRSHCSFQRSNGDSRRRSPSPPRRRSPSPPRRRSSPPPRRRSPPPPKRRSSPPPSRDVRRQKSPPSTSRHYSPNQRRSIKRERSKSPPMRSVKREHSESPPMRSVKRERSESPPMRSFKRERSESPPMRAARRLPSPPPRTRKSSPKISRRSPSPPPRTRKSSPKISRRSPSPYRKTVKRERSPTPSPKRNSFKKSPSPKRQSRRSPSWSSAASWSPEVKKVKSTVTLVKHR